MRQANPADRTYSLPGSDELGLVVAPTGGEARRLRHACLHLPEPPDLLQKPRLYNTRG